MNRPSPNNLIFISLIIPALLSIYAKNVTAEQLVFSSVIDATISIVQCEAILRRAYASLGYEIRVDTYPGKRALAVANRGESDGELCRVAGLENYDNLIPIETPLLALEVVAFAHMDWPSDTLDSLSKHHIGILRGIIATEKMTRGMQRSTHNNLATLFRLLNGKRLDIVLTMQGDGMLYIRESELQGSIKTLQPSLAEIPIYHYLHKKHIALAPRINKALKLLYETGEYDQVMKNVSKTY